MSDDTTSDLRDAPPGRRSRWTRHAGVALLTLMLAAAAVGLLGPRTADTSDSAGDWSLGVTYPQITRAGQPSPLTLTVTNATGFGDTVRIRLCDELFDDLDFQAWYPAPSSETDDGPWLYYEFDPPPSGNRLEISLDARTAPGHLGGRLPCDIAVLSGDQPTAQVSFTVWRLP
ncbi:hypothetical protein [Nocardioides sp. InS609-2]|uniref:hypothetical protein n=1 Tax=Nocardioides sp. InS609-2 TaxID=2760705 RepID=UPI0020BE24BF|nr:hypothetical protein [Nocardioides sp. InS609-2]